MLEKSPRNCDAQLSLLNCVIKCASNYQLIKSSLTTCKQDSGTFNKVFTARLLLEQQLVWFLLPLIKVTVVWNSME